MADARPLRIVHVTEPGPVGGLETVVRSLAVGHHERGHAVHVVAIVKSRDGAGAFLESLERRHVDTIVRQIPGRAYLREMRTVHGLLRALRPDVVHTHGARADLLHLPVARALGVPIVTTLHGSSRPSGLAGLGERVETAVLRWFDAVVAVSSPLARELEGRGISPRRIHLIPNATGIAEPPLERSAARQALALPQDGPPRIGWVGRMIPVKGADLFLRALSLMTDIPWSASLVGDGPELTRLRTLAHERGLCDRVRFHGAVPDAGRLDRAFDLFVLSSRSEGIPMVLFEAMAARTPIVAAAVGGVPDVLSDAHAWLVPPHDEAGLAAAMRQALAEPAECRRRAAAAHRRASAEFGTATWMDRHEALYRSLSRHATDLGVEAATSHAAG